MPRLTDETLKLTLIVNGDQSRVTLMNLQKEADKLRTELNKTAREMSKLTETDPNYAQKKKEFEAQTTALDNLNQKYKEAAKAIDLNTMSFRELQKLLREQKMNLDAITQGTEAHKLLSQEYIETANAIKNYNQRLKDEAIGTIDLNKEVNLNAMSLDKLEERYNQLELAMKKSNPDPEKMKQYRLEMERVEGRMTQLRTGAGQLRQAFDSWAEKLNTYQTAIATIGMSFYGLYQGIANYISGTADLSDKIAGVVKNTDLSTEGVRELMGEYKKFDTRTTTAQLLEISEIAGKLGITGKDNILSFTRESNQAIVAFGKDLGNSADEIINTMGKIIGAYGLDKSLGWDKSMRHLGSVINELAKSSTSSEKPIVEYISRLSAVGDSAGISIDKIAALGATLDSVKVNAEMGGTAMQKFIMGMAKDSNIPKFAKLLGLSVEEYKSKVNADTFGVMKQLLVVTKSNKKGLMEVAQSLGDAEVSGERMIMTVGKLQNNMDELNKQEAIAAKQWKEGTSLQNEYATMNDNFAGRLERSKKVIEGFTMSLKSGLEPATGAIIEKTGQLFGWLTQHIGVVKALGKAVITLATFFGVYKAVILSHNVYTTVAIALKSLWTKVTTLWTAVTNTATRAQALLNLTTKATPWGLIIGFIGAAAAAYAMFREELTNAQKVQKTLNDVQARAKTTLAEEQTATELLIMVAKDETRSKTERLEALKKLHDISPKYLGGLTLETVTTKEAKRATDEYIKSLEKKALIQAAQEELTSIKRQKIQIKSGASSSAETSTMQDIGNFAASFLTSDMSEVQKDYAKRTKLSSEINKDKEWRQLDAQEQALLNLVKDAKVSDINSNDNTSTDITKTTGYGSNSTTEKEADKRKKKLEEKYKAELENINNEAEIAKLSLGLKQHSKADELELEADHQEKVAGLKQKYVKSGILTQHEVAISQLQSQKASFDASMAILEEEEKKFKEKNDLEKAAREAEINDMNVDENYKKVLQKEMNMLLLENEMDFHQQMLDAGGIYDEQQKQAEKNKIAALKAAYEKLNIERTSAYLKYFDKVDKEGSALSPEEIAAKKAKEAKDKAKEKREGKSKYGLQTDFEKYQEDKQNIEQDVTDGKLSKQDGQIAIWNKRAEAFKSITNTITGIWAQGVEARKQKEMAGLDQRMNAELAAAGTNEAKKKEIEEKFAKEKTALTKKYAKQEMRIKVINAIADTAVSVAKTFAQFGWPLGIGPAIAAGAAGAIQVGAILAQAKQVDQAGEGDYTSVIGKTDKKRYKAQQSQNKGANIIDKPVLVSEKGAEFVVDNNTLFSQKSDEYGLTAMDYARKIANIRFNAPTPQYAMGRYSSSGLNSSKNEGTVNQSQNNEMLMSIMGKLSKQLDEGIQAQTVFGWDHLDKLNKANDRMTKINDSATLK